MTTGDVNDVREMVTCFMSYNTSEDVMIWDDTGLNYTYIYRLRTCEAKYRSLCRD